MTSNQTVFIQTFLIEFQKLFKHLIQFNTSSELSHRDIALLSLLRITPQILSTKQSQWLQTVSTNFDTEHVAGTLENSIDDLPNVNNVIQHAAEQLAEQYSNFLNAQIYSDASFSDIKIFASSGIWNKRKVLQKKKLKHLCEPLERPYFT